MLRHATGHLSRCARLHSTEAAKPSIKLVAELRKLTEVSIVKAREALSASNNDVSAALEWLEKDLVASGTKKAAKLGGRATGEGLISVSVLSNGPGRLTATGSGSVRAAMIELNCETDFVGRNDLFGRLAADIAHTAAFMTEPEAAESGILFRSCSLDMLRDAPLISQNTNSTGPHSASATVSSSIRDLIAKVGENVSLRRAVTAVQLPISQNHLALRLASYIHGSINDPSQGRTGALALLALKSPRLAAILASEEFQTDLAKLERSLARQIVGFDTVSITGAGETALYEQPFLMFPGDLAQQPTSVREVLDTWSRAKGLLQEGEEGEVGGLEVLEFEKWTVGGEQ